MKTIPMTCGVVKVLSVTCDCGKEVKNYRGLLVHLSAGCPCSIYEFYQEEVSIDAIRKMYPRLSKARIVNMIVLEAMRRKVRPAPSVSSIPI